MRQLVQKIEGFVGHGHSEAIGSELVGGASGRGEESQLLPVSGVGCDWLHQLAVHAAQGEAHAVGGISCGQHVLIDFPWQW